jgi:conjugal transfer pilus assembly protein TraI
MSPRPPPGGIAAQPFPSTDPGFEALPLPAILASQHTLLGRIKLCFGADRESFDRELMPLVYGYASFVHLLPATADNYFSAPGGLLQLGLETAFFSLQGTDAHIFSGRATISERRELEPRWRIATFVGGLCCELHRALSHLIVTTADGEEWPAFLGGLVPWLEKRSAGRYFVRWRPAARESRGLGLFALPHVVPADVLQMLASGNSLIVPQLMASIGGVPVYHEHNVLDELVRRSMALVIDRNLLTSADRYGKPQYGSHLERYLVDALRRLAAGHSAWTPNREKSRLWLGLDGLFLVWPGAADDLLSLLESDQLAGIPKSPHTLLEILLAAGVLVPPAADRQTWTIQPPGAKTSIDAVKLASSAILIAGLEPPPIPLEGPLLASATRPPQQPARQAPPSSEPPQATPVGDLPAESAPPARGPRASRAPAEATSGSVEQLSLLDAPEAPEPVDAAATNAAGSAAAAPTAAAKRPTVTLKAPMRLNPAVREVLAEIVATLNEPAGLSSVCTVTEGIFVPLSDFDRHGLQPTVAIRALDEARMLWRAKAAGPPTVLRQVHGSDTIGVVLDPAHVDGLDPAAFAPDGEPPTEATPASAAVRRRRS